MTLARVVGCPIREEEDEDYGKVDASEDDLAYGPDPENLRLGAYYAYQIVCKRRNIQIL
jgi:hypothetical protein